jgi:predicted RNA binding protein YcfA (HicA-like mRNA interferase family)
MSRLSSTKSSRVLSTLLRIGWQIKRTTGSHRVLERSGWPDVILLSMKEKKSVPACSLV